MSVADLCLCDVCDQGVISEQSCLAISTHELVLYSLLWGCK